MITTRLNSLSTYRFAPKPISTVQVKIQGLVHYRYTHVQDTLWYTHSCTHTGRQCLPRISVISMFAE